MMKKHNKTFFLLINRARSFTDEHQPTFINIHISIFRKEERLIAAKWVQLNIHFTNELRLNKHKYSLNCF